MSPRRPAAPYGIEGIEISRDGPARHDLAPEAAGLHAVSLGLSALAGDDDHVMIERSFVVYDGLFAYLRFASQERHNWPVKAA